jgi:hypothetical protein
MRAHTCTHAHARTHARTPATGRLCVEALLAGGFVSFAISLLHGKVSDADAVAAGVS